MASLGKRRARDDLALKSRKCLFSLRRPESEDSILSVSDNPLFDVHESSGFYDDIVNELPIADLSPPTPGHENVPPNTPKGRIPDTLCAQRNPLEDITDKASDEIEVWVTLDDEIHSFRAGSLAMMLPNRFQASTSCSSRTQAIDNILSGKGLPS